MWIGNEPNFTAYGGYHDAGDADRRTYHMDVTATLLTTYEAFPDCFTDDQFNIPDKFDAAYNIVGKGTSVPAVTALPRERRYIDNLPSIQWNEFTVYQSLCFPASVYPVLGQGGTWDETKDPFAVRQE